MLPTDHYSTYNQPRKVPMEQILHEIDVVVYNKFCLDGFGSAHITHEYVRNTGGDVTKTTFIAMEYNYSPQEFDDLLKICAGKSVYMVDFSLKRDKIIELRDKCKSLTILDHHITAQDELAGIENINCVFDMTRSGVGITWEYFNERPIPDWCKYIQDRDLWKWEFEETKPFTLALMEVEYSHEKWRNMNINELIAGGRELCAVEEEAVKAALKTYMTTETTINGVVHKIAYVNSDKYISEIGNALAIQSGISLGVVYLHTKNTTRFSLRSVEPSENPSATLTAKDIAAMFGGGGHKHAAGCTINGDVLQLPLSD